MAARSAAAAQVSLGRSFVLPLQLQMQVVLSAKTPDIAEIVAERFADVR
jgi:hypothetical protein